MSVAEQPPRPHTASEPLDPGAGPEPRKKIFVAVHGIGDQFNYETIQSVAYRLCRYCDQPAALPLGRFHSQQVAKNGVLYLRTPPDPGLPAYLGFAEVYWADIPRSEAKEGFVLEEARAWARTLVEKMRMIYGEHTEIVRGHDYRVLVRVIDEMIQTVNVADRLAKLGDMAGLFKFELKRILIDYLGDVQIVTEFEEIRERLVGRFLDLMRQIHQAEPDADLYIVAHSEGTVVSFLGLVRAMSDPAGAPGWVGQVRGYMTFGSPLNKHVIIWPELFEPHRRALWKPDSPARRIAWRNYYDYGDPIGFDLGPTRDWMKPGGWHEVFEFEDDHDFGFSRYPFHGQAHNDYWTDPHVFGHFIQTVVEPPSLRPPGAKPQDFRSRPPSIHWKQAFCYVAPYLLSATLMFLAVYVLYKATLASLGETRETFDVLRDVSGIAMLLGGMTILARIPRVTRTLFWRGLALILFAGSLWAYAAVVTETTRDRLAPWTASHLGISNTAAMLAVTALVSLLVSWISRAFPDSGMKPLMIVGCGAVALLVTSRIWEAGQKPESLWPLFLGGAGFLYLWWLAALNFDLGFIWHRFIRHSASLKRMRTLFQAEEKTRAVRV